MSDFVMDVTPPIHAPVKRWSNIHRANEPFHYNNVKYRRERE
jgi:hypothetical protein